MKVYSIDVKICGTAYVKAKNKREAERKLKKELYDSCLEVPEDDVTISGRDYDDPKLPEVSLSPSMTVYGPFDDESTLELAED